MFRKKISFYSLQFLLLKFLNNSIRCSLSYLMCSRCCSCCCKNTFTCFNANLFCTKRKLLQIQKIYFETTSYHSFNKFVRTKELLISICSHLFYLGYNFKFLIWAVYRFYMKQKLLVM